MYNPTHFKQTHLDVLHQFIQDTSFGILISSGKSGIQVSPLPFILYPTQGKYGTLCAHIARNNPHWQEFINSPECVVTFQGETNYISPEWLAEKSISHKVVPTWNYCVTEVRGIVAIIQDEDWLYRHLHDSTEFHEKARQSRWSLSDAPPEFIASLTKHIVGVEISITDIDGKWKLSQNRNENDINGISKGLSDKTDPHCNLAMAELIKNRPS